MIKLLMSYEMTKIMITQRTLPKIRDSISFLYFDRCIVEQDANAIAIFQKDTKYQIPCANLSTDRKSTRLNSSHRT